MDRHFVHREDGRGSPRAGGRGVVVCGGGDYLLCALVNIRMLRMLGCGLPVELWHFGNERLPAPARARLRSWGVKTRLLPVLPHRFASKPYAIHNSEFGEVLCMDADNTPLRNPEFLFTTAEYLETGALFWPDFYPAAANEAWEQLALMSPQRVMEQESGQLVINRELHAKAMGKTLEMNYRYPAIRHLLWGAKGDKDTFQLSWFATRSRFHMVDYFPGMAGKRAGEGCVGNTIVQFDLAGKPLFLHNNGRKWHLTRPVERAWEMCVFSKDRSGCGIEVTVTQSGRHHQRRFEPADACERMPAEAVIGDVEDRCMREIGWIRRRLWYQWAALGFLLRRKLRGQKLAG